MQGTQVEEIIKQMKTILDRITAAKDNPAEVTRLVSEAKTKLDQSGQKSER